MLHVNTTITLISSGWLTFIDGTWLSDLSGPALILILVIIAIWSLKSFYRMFTTADEEISTPLTATTTTVVMDDKARSVLIYPGDQLNFSNEDLINILERRFKYYNGLNLIEREKFIKRLKQFINDKVFSIHDKLGFKEMPVLIAACAIQLTFGLDKYLLPHFKNIHVYPAEFLGVYPTVRFLMGNVSGDTINIGWKYFMEGIDNKSDGKNLGLHEMSHALYYETFVVGQNVDREFKKTFNQFTLVGDHIYTSNKEEQVGLYSSYALKNFQEFWAESVELFFERPQEMHVLYPHLYASMSDLLEQDPLLW